MASIKIVIPKTGLSQGKRTPVIEVDGVVGTSCATLTGALVDRLGTQVAEETQKPEYHQQVDQRLQQGL
jgi:deoxyadenosine/deoxycytidine kinase